MFTKLKICWVTDDKHGQYIVKVDYMGWFGFGKPTSVIYTGDGTVYHNLLNGKRPSTHIEMLLSEAVWHYRYTKGQN